MAKQKDYDELEAAYEAAKILHTNGFEAYIIGGAVRDIWLGREPKDFDLVTNATPEQVMRIAEFGSSNYKDTAQAYGVTRVKFTHLAPQTPNNHTYNHHLLAQKPSQPTHHIPDMPPRLERVLNSESDGSLHGYLGLGGLSTEYELEIATFRRDIEAYLGRKETKVEFATLEDDVLRRDFTINALALDLYTNQIIDFVDGISDLEDKLIRFIGSADERILEDPLRIMRAIRFKNHLEFSYHDKTISAIKNAAKSGYVEKIAADRKRMELTKLLVHPTRRQAIYDLYKFGILGRILPEVTAGVGINQPPEFHSEGDVWQHELIILNNLPTHPSKRLAWAALLHDIGKAVTISMPEDTSDRIHFNRHYAIGAAMAAKILTRLRFPKKEITDICWMIQNHMTIDDLPAMRPSHQQKMLENPAFEDLLELHKADAASSWAPNKPHNLKPDFKEIEALWQEHKSKPPEVRAPSLKRDLDIDGTWILKNFGQEFDLKPSPIIGTILEELQTYYKDTRDKNPKKYLTKTRKLLASYR